VKRATRNTCHAPGTDRAPWTVTATAADFNALHRHLFQGNHREHAAFALAGVAHTDVGTRLLVREVYPVPDEDFAAGDTSYQLSSRAVARAGRRAREAGLSLLWAHSHPGSGARVGFSPQDHATMQRAHPTMLEMVGAPVGALVLGERAVAGELWESGTAPRPLASLRTLGPKISDHNDGRSRSASSKSERHARQILLFGDAGQARLERLRVAVLGAGGGGSIAIEQLCRIGVGEILAFDDDVVSTSNLSRIVGSRPSDARRRRPKVEVARRHVRRIDRAVRVRAIEQSIDNADSALLLAGVDAIFVATDTTLGRYAANALAYQYMIPTFQVGAKVQANADGQIDTIHTAARIALPGYPCLQCQRAIPAEQLRLEQAGEVERRAQNYLGGGEDIVDPSVISLNSIPVGIAVTDFMLMFCGLLDDGADLSTRIWYPRERRSARRVTGIARGCSWCDATSELSCFARADSWPLPLPRAAK
jgi:molybdopterin/thiamine biosynthesis adenylyltransferase